MDTNSHIEPVDMLNVIQTLNDISAENDDQEICVICQDILDNGEQVHFLPECNHGYHTNCILTWFRTGNNNCPCCGNRGVNFKEPKQRAAPRGRWKIFLFKEVNKTQDMLCLEDFQFEKMHQNN